MEINHVLIVEDDKEIREGVQNWDGIINANAAAVHLEQAQSLLSGSADIDSFMTAHQDAISAAE